MFNIFNIYNNLIYEYCNNSKNFGKLLIYTHLLHANNPLCGDNIKIYLNIINNKIEDIKFFGDGCAISKASSSLMVELLHNKDLFYSNVMVKYFFSKICCYKNDNTDFSILETNSKKKILLFDNVKKFPMRVKCVTLSWNAISSLFK